LASVYSPVCKINSTTSSGNIDEQELEYLGGKYLPAQGRSWRCSLDGLEKLKKSLDNKFIPDNVKDKIRNEIEKLESEVS
jgi:hypothetical protein